MNTNEMIARVFFEYNPEDTNHVWETDSYGIVDEYAYMFNYCAGRHCTRCHKGFCIQCDPLAYETPCYQPLPNYVNPFWIDELMVKLAERGVAIPFSGMLTLESLHEAVIKAATVYANRVINRMQSR